MNTYRLIKSAGTFGVALPEKVDATTFRRPMLLLATAIGCPQIAETLFERLDTLADKTRFGDVAEPFVDPGDNGTTSKAAERRRLAEFLSGESSATWKRLTAAELNSWLDRIAQFSFNLRETLATPGPASQPTPPIKARPQKAGRRAG